MIPDSLLRLIVLAEGAAVLLAVVALFGHGAWLRQRARGDDRSMARAREALAEALAGDVSDGEEPTIVAAMARERLPPRIWSRLVVEIAPSLGGRQWQDLTALADALGLIRRARRRCDSRRWWRRLDGAYHLTLFGSDLPEGLLSDENDAVRAQVLEWMGDHPSAERADAVMEALDDPSPLCRYAARDALLRFGSVLVDAIVGRLGAEERPHVVVSLLELAAWRPNPGYQARALGLARHESPPVRAAAARLLGGLGGQEGVAMLEALVVDDSAAVRAEAVGALGKLGHWPSARVLAPALRDPAWVVRKAAGEALAELGAPGALLLGRYANDDDPYAAEMAQQAQQLAVLRSARPGETRR